MKKTIMPVDTTIAIGEEPGIYLIRCLANNATYTGASLLPRTSIETHLSQLRAGASPAYRMQHDWDFYGKDLFEFMFCAKPVAELAHWEETMTLLLDSLDDTGGYCRQFGGRDWSLSSRVRDTEEKLRKGGKFSFLPGVTATERINPMYLRTYCVASVPFSVSDPLLTMKMDPVRKRMNREDDLEAFSVYVPARDSRRD